MDLFDPENTISAHVFDDTVGKSQWLPSLFPLKLVLNPGLLELASENWEASLALDFSPGLVLTSTCAYQILTLGLN